MKTIDTCFWKEEKFTHDFKAVNAKYFFFVFSVLCECLWRWNIDSHQTISTEVKKLLSLTIVIASLPADTLDFAAVVVDCNWKAYRFAFSIVWNQPNHYSKPRNVCLLRKKKQLHGLLWVVNIVTQLYSKMVTNAYLSTINKYYELWQRNNDDGP